MQIIIFSTLFLLGVYLVYSDVFVIVPRFSIQSVAKIKNFSVKNKHELLINRLSTYVIRFVKLPQYKAEEYERMLNFLGQSFSANEYVAKMIIESSMYVLLGIIAIPIQPIVFFISIASAFIIYNSKTKSLKSKYLKRKEEIELELPKFCSVINSRIKSTSNVSAILQSFLPISGKAMADEIIITLTDMKTGSPELALRRMEQRISSNKVSDIIRGLISVQNGDDQSVYFQSKQYQFNNDYLMAKRKNISKRPLKLTPPGVLAFVFFILIIMYPLAENMDVITKNVM